MRRTEILQEIRKMRFEEAYEVWTERRLSQEEAARIKVSLVTSISYQPMAGTKK